MTLRLYDTATRSVRDFVPKTPGQAGIYLCGLTVQAAPHIGHLRSAVNYDVLRRWMLHAGLDVTFVRNVTDVDDKILVKSLEQGRPFWAIAEHSMCHPGRPRPHGDGQEASVGSAGFTPFQSAKSR